MGREGVGLVYPTLGRDTTRFSVPEGGNISMACLGTGNPAPDTM